MNIKDFAEKHNMFPKGGLVLCALSGGRDSMCLLSLLLSLAPQLGFSVAAAHFNHNLRGDESDGDEKFVEDYCREKSIPCYIGSGDVKGEAEKCAIGIEEAARKLRYEFLKETAEKIGAERVATAHNADDNAETVLFNLTRGSGLKGLCGIPPVRDIYVRPLLGVTRAEIDRYITENSVPYRDDSTNALDDYTRNNLRHNVVPVLRGINPSFEENVADTVSLLAEDEKYLSSLAESFIEENIKGSSLPAEKLANLPVPVSSRVIRLMCPKGITQAHTGAVLNLCRAENPSASADLPGITVRREYENIVFSDGEVSDFSPVILHPGEVTEIPSIGLSFACEATEEAGNIYNSLNTFFLKSDLINGDIVIRPRQTGDTIRLSEKGGTKTLKKLFIEKRIPAAKRHLIPVIADNSGVIAVPGIGTDLRLRAASKEAVLKITVKEINKHV